MCVAADTATGSQTKVSCKRDLAFVCVCVFLVSFGTILGSDVYFSGDLLLLCCTEPRDRHVKIPCKRPYIKVHLMIAEGGTTKFLEAAVYEKGELLWLGIFVLLLALMWGAFIVQTL